MSGYSDIVWRLKEQCRKARWRPWRFLLVKLYETALWLGGGWISWESEFAGKPCLPHGISGVFVSRYARVGKNCVLFQQVTIGSNTLPDSSGLGAPVLGDECYLGAGAKVIGRVTVGHRARLGANSVVRESVPEDGIVPAGGPAVVSSHRLTNRFYTRRGGRWVYYDDGRWLAEQEASILERLNGTFP